MVRSTNWNWIVNTFQSVLRVVVIQHERDDFEGHFCCNFTPIFTHAKSMEIHHCTLNQ